MQGRVYSTPSFACIEFVDLLMDNNECMSSKEN